jgi:hypothetical protein
MEPISIPAHFDGEQIVLDEPRNLGGQRQINRYRSA